MQPFFAVIVGQEGTLLWSEGDPYRDIVVHSTAKPFQLLPVLDRGLDRKYGLNKEEVVLLASSHLAQTEHIKVLQSIMRKTGLREADMVLPADHPHGRISYHNWLVRQDQKQKRYHPCSGNHLAIMLLQRELTGCVRNYHSEESPAQQEILQYIRRYFSVEPKLLTDNCGIPTYQAPALAIATAYQRFACDARSSDSVYRFSEALHKSPLMIEGDHCIATLLNADTDLIAKTGVNGLLAVGMIQEQLGLAVWAQSGFTVSTPVTIQIIRNLKGRQESFLSSYPTDQTSPISYGKFLPRLN